MNRICEKVRSSPAFAPVCARNGSHGTSQQLLPAMNAEEFDEFLKAFSGRNFLRTGSAALATTFLGEAATLRGQERPNTQAPP